MSVGEANLHFLPFLIRPRRVVGCGQHVEGLAIPDDAAEDPAERQEDLLCRVPGPRLACRTSFLSVGGTVDPYIHSRRALVSLIIRTAASLRLQRLRLCKGMETPWDPARLHQSLPSARGSPGSKHAGDAGLPLRHSLSEHEPAWGSSDGGCARTRRSMCLMHVSHSSTGAPSDWRIFCRLLTRQLHCPGWQPW